MRSKRQREKDLKKVQEKQSEIKQRQEIKTMQKRTEQIITSLDEKNRRALMQLGRIIERLGIDFAEQKLAEAEIVEEQGGLMIAELKRRRTKGGVFFFLVKKALREEERKEDLREIFYKNQFDWLEENKGQELEGTDDSQQPGAQKPPRSPQPAPKTDATPAARKPGAAPQEPPRKAQPALPTAPPAFQKAREIRKPAPPSGTASTGNARSATERKKPGPQRESANLQEPR